MSYTIPNIRMTNDFLGGQHSGPPRHPGQMAQRSVSVVPPRMSAFERQLRARLA